MLKKYYRFLFLVVLMAPLGLSAQSTATPATLPYSTAFEEGDDTTWSYNNNGNGWYIGSAVNHTQGGSKALYISNTNGATHAFNPNIPSSSYAYRAINFESAGQHILNFDWLNNGMGSMYGMQFTMCMLYAYLVPTSTTMAGSDLAPEDDWIPCVESSLGGVTTWQHATLAIDVPTAGTYYLAFWFYSMGAGGSPTAAVDNISLTRLGCLQPTGLTATSLSGNQINFQWIPGGSETEWIVRHDGGSWTTVLDSSYLFTDIAASMLHSLEVAAVCSNGDTSLISSITHRSDCGIVSSFPWRENFSGFSFNAALPCWSILGNGMTRFIGGELELHPSSGTSPYHIVTPSITDLSQLELTFTTHPEMSSSGSLTVGYITGPDNSYVFTPVTTYNVNEWVDVDIPVVKTVTFPGAPDTARVAFRHNPNASNSYWYIDDVDLHVIPTCARPYNLTLADASDNSLMLTWSDSNSSTSSYMLCYRLTTDTEWDTLIVYDTAATIGNLQSSTTYEVSLSTTCNDGSASNEITGTFMTVCPTIEDFPYEENFDGGSALCWQVLNMNNTGADNWNYNTNTIYNRNQSSGAYLSRYNDSEPCNEWLISPPIVLSSEMDNATLSWYSYAKAFWDNEPRIEVKVSTTVATDTLAFATTIYSEDLNETSFTRHIASLGQFAGETVHIAFVRRGFDDDDVILEDISIYDAQSPEVSIAGVTSPVVGLAATYRAVLDDGSRDNLTYTWASTAVAAGSATMTAVDSATITLLYTTTTPDVLTLVASNTYGNDTAVMTVTPVVATYTSLPYSTGFENGDDVAWTFANDNVNAWYIGTTVHATGNRALYISDDNGTSNSYNNSATSHSYASKAFNLATNGQYHLSFDWRCFGEGTFDNMMVYLAPLGSAITAGTDADITWIPLTNELNTADTWQHFSTIFDLTVPGVYNVVFAWKNDFTDGTNPPAAVDNFTLSVVSCVAPGAIAVDAIGPNTAQFHWSGTAAAYEVTVGDRAPVVVTDTFYTATALQPATDYDVYVRAICGPGDSSLHVSQSITTDCTPFSVPFYHDFPSATLDICWTNQYTSPTPATSWSEGTTTNHRIYSAAAYSANPTNDWLITPVIDIPTTDTASLELVFFVYGYRSNNYAASMASYEVLVSPSGDLSYASFTDTVTVETDLDTNTFMRRNFSMSNYAGHNIRIAFRNTGTYNSRIVLGEVSLRRTREPLFSLEGPSAVWINDYNTFSGIYQEGDLTGMSYSWTSSMAAAGNAVMTGATTDILGIVYSTTGTDTLTFVAHNNYGNDTVIAYVTVQDLAPVTTFPYSTGFEPSNGDNLNWIALNGANAWTLGNATDTLGTQAYYISKDHGATHTYNFTTTSLSYLYRAFDITTTGEYLFRFDWNTYGEGNYDFLRAWLVPDSLFHAQANEYPASIITSNYSLTTADIPGWTRLGGKLNLSNHWNTQTDTVTINTTGRYLMVFLWVNDGSMGHNPPAAIDNVTVIYDPSAPCETPVIDFVSTTEDSIFFSFADVADSYEVAIVQGAWSTPDNPIHVTTNNFGFSGLLPETQYTIGVRAVCNIDNHSSWDTLVVTTAALPCAAPIGVTASNIGYTTVTLTWIPAAPDQTLFDVHVSGINHDSIYSVGAATLTLDNLTSDVEYSVEVRAVCSPQSHSEWTPVHTFRTSKCNEITGLTVTTVTATTATLTWNAASSNAVRYEVEYGEAGFREGYGTTVRSDGTTVTLSELLEENSYDAYVRVYCTETIFSNWSEKVSFTTTTEGIDEAAAARIALYPNPASSLVTLTGIDGEATVTVVDMNGRAVASFAICDSELEFDVSSLSSGAYFVRITSQRVSAIRKLIVR